MTDTYIERSLAIVIGINQYEHIRKLNNAVHDAEELATVLKERYEYNVLLLTDTKATNKELCNLLENLQKNIIKLPNNDEPISIKESDRVLFYFAGHGIAEKAEERKDKDVKPAGYLMPQDSQGDDKSTWLSMQELHDALISLNCRHLLMILDCCFAGGIRWAELKRNSGGFGRKMYQQSYDRFIKFPAQQVITSASHDEEAQDTSRFGQRGDENGHSPFADLLLKVLKAEPDKVKNDNYLKAIIEDEVITVQELFTYLQNKLWYGTEKQTPGLFLLRKHNKGEYIFPLSGFKRENLELLKLDESTNPYKSLASFETKDSQLFFGRKRLIEDSKDPIDPKKGLLSKVSNYPLTVVLGLSGSGKSSLVKAGLIPALKSEEWCILNPIRPGEVPLISLARAILPIKNVDLVNQLTQVNFLDNILKSKTKPEQESGINDEEKGKFNILVKAWEGATPEAKILLVLDYFEQLKKFCSNSQKESLFNLNNNILETFNSLIKSPQSLSFTAIIKQWTQNNQNIKLLLVIDQSEELITLSRNDQERENFLNLLAEALVTPELSAQLRIVLTLRSEFEPQIRDTIKETYWQKAWQDGRFIVTPMNREELQQVIEEPAAQRALFFESPKLVNDLIDEVVQMPGALPLLSFTLSELYLKYLKAEANQERNDRTITEADYQKIGGVTRSLTQTADKTYNNLVAEQVDEKTKKAYESTIRDVMLRMVAISGGEISRRRVPISELVYLEPKNEQVQKVTERFLEARLLVKGLDAEGQEYIEPAHDALVRGWAKLKDWMDQELDRFILRQRLTSAANDWTKNPQDSSLLWTEGVRLKQVEKILKQENNWFNKQEAEFVEQSIKQKRKQEDELTQNRINELTPSANSRFRDHEQLEALTYILKAGKLLQKLIHEDSPHLNKETRLNTQLVLQQILSKVEEKNRFMLPSASVNAVDFSRDGQIIATVDGKGIVKLFDPEGKQINPTEMNGDILMRIFNHPQGEMVTLRGGSKYLYLLTPDGILQFPKLYLSPDGEMFAQPGQQGKGIVTLYSRDCRELKTLTGLKEDTIMTVAFSPDSQVIASGGWQGWLSLWNRDGEMIAGQGTGGGSFNTIDFSPNGEIIATGSNDGKVRFWKPDGTHLHEFKAHSDTIWGLCFSPNGEMFATGSNDRKVKLWKLDGTEVKTLEGHTGIVRAVAFDPNDNHNLASASDDGSVKIWNLGGTGLKVLDRHEDSVNKVRFSPDGKTILTTSGHGKVSFWRTDGTLFKQESWHNGPISTLDFSPNGERIVTASGDKEVKLHNSDGDFIEDIKKWDGSEWDGIEVLGASFSPNNKMIALADQQGSVKIYNLGDRTFKTLCKGSGYPAWAVKFSPDGNILASAHHEGVVAVWQLDGTLVNTLPRYQEDTTLTKSGGVYYNSVIGIDFSPKGDLIASAHLDGTVKLWKLGGSSDKPLILGEYSNRILVGSLRFSPNGDLIASAHADGTVKLWNLDGSLHKILEGHKSRVNAVDFSPNGKTLASASEDRTVILWDLDGNIDIDGLLNCGCKWAEGYLTNNPNITEEDRQIILNINKNP